MIVDSSALMAILLREPEGDRMIDAAMSAPRLLLSAASYLEAAVVADTRAQPATRTRFDRVLDALGVEVVPFTVDQAHLAREAYRRYGRGSGHPARLNLGDCFSYALAAESGDALLFKGNDFAATDVLIADY